MPDIVLLGEAWGEVEERERMAFVGPTGWELNRMLEQAGIKRVDCFCTNVFNLRPTGNKIESLCGPREMMIPGYPSIGKAGYIRKQYLPQLQRLGEELDEIKPNLIVALGNTAAWAMLGKTMISKIRGTVQMSTHTRTGIKVLPTYHPAVIFRQWGVRPTAVMDLVKAKREARYPDIVRPKREIWIEPTLEDIYDFIRDHINPCEKLAIDIETAGNFITCIGFAPRKDIAIVIPGLGIRRAGRPYWPSVDAEREVYKAIKDIITGPKPKIFQNGLYDIAFIWRAWGIRTYNAEEDTMLLHHALQPESLKGLGFLGSIYTDEVAWKQMREKHTTIKRDD
jgi:uracil-DNA glycosylase